MRILKKGTRVLFRKPVNDDYREYDRFNGKTLRLLQDIDLHEPSHTGRGAVLNWPPGAIRITPFMNAWVHEIKAYGFGPWLRTKGK